MKRFAPALLIAGALAAPALANDPGPAPSRPPSPGANYHPKHALWEYEGENGPMKWSEVDPKFRACNLGKRQSPIDIDSRTVEKGGLKPIQFNYDAGPAEIVNNGHTIQVNLAKSGSARFEALEYKLAQFHFHTPSEEKIDGMAQPMVVHLVHRAGDTRIAVVAVLIKLGKENKTLKPVFDQLPKVAGASAKLDSFNPADLVPFDPTYFAYVGSLTTPPCTEEVKWHVMQKPIEISYKQLAAFKALYKKNARPVQPLNGRRIQVYAE
jgi:carbonic anhydrase